MCVWRGAAVVRAGKRPLYADAYIYIYINAYICGLGKREFECNVACKWQVRCILREWQNDMRSVVVGRWLARICQFKGHA